MPLCIIDIIASNNIIIHCISFFSGLQTLKQISLIGIALWSSALARSQTPGRPLRYTLMILWSHVKDYRSIPYWSPSPLTLRKWFLCTLIMVQTLLTWAFWGQNCSIRLKKKMKTGGIKLQIEASEERHIHLCIWQVQNDTIKGLPCF